MNPALLLLATLAIIYLAKRIYKYFVNPWENCPPGPFFGIFDWELSPLKTVQAIQLLNRSPLMAFDNLIQKYGPVVRIQMGGQHAILLGGLDEIREFASLEETTGRPYNKVLLNMYSGGDPLGFGIGIGGLRWKEQRRFAMRALKDLSEGQKGMEDKILNEVRHTIEHIKRLLTQTTDNVIPQANKLFEVPNLNVIWGLVAALRFDYTDPEPGKQFEYLRAFLGEKLAGPITFVPWLHLIFPFSSIYNRIIRAMDSFRILLKNVIKDQRCTYDENSPRGYIDLFLRAQEQKQGDYFTDKDLLIGCQDLFIAGSETTTSSLTSMILYMVLYPQVQAQIQHEIDQFVGRDREVTFEDRANLPFTDATIMEVRRIATPFPVTPPRMSTKDLVIGGYLIPKGLPVQMCLYSVLKGSAYWKEPEKFNPKRFFNGEGKLQVPDAFIPFGFGKRRCVGEKLGTVSNFIFLANLLQNFSFKCEDEKRMPNESLVGGLTYCPGPFNIRVTTRLD